MILDKIMGLVCPKHKKQLSLEYIESLNSRIRTRNGKFKNEKSIGEVLTVTIPKGGTRYERIDENSWRKTGDYKKYEVILIGNVTAEDMMRWILVHEMSEKYWASEYWVLITCPKDRSYRVLTSDEIVNKLGSVTLMSY